MKDPMRAMKGPNAAMKSRVGVHEGPSPRMKPANLRSKAALPVTKQVLPVSRSLASLGTR